MKPLVTAQRMLTWLSVFPIDENVSLKKRLAYTSFTTIILTGLLGAVVSGSVYFMKYQSIDLQQALYAVLHLTLVTQALYMYAIIYRMRYKTKMAFQHLTNIYNQHKNDENSFQYLAKANDVSEWMWPIYWIFSVFGFFVGIPITIIIPILIRYLKYRTFDMEHVEHPFGLAVPWNSNTIPGYIGETYMGLLMGSCYLVFNGTILLPYISICLHHDAFHKMFQHFAQKFNHSDRDRNDERLIVKLICLGNTTKDWFIETADIFSPLIVILLISNMVSLASFVFELDSHIQHNKFDLFLLIGAMVTLSNLFLYCFFGKLASESFERLADCLYECNWQDLSIKLQKYLILMIASRQKPLNYHGFGVVILNLQTFCKILRTTYTYYMMLKTLTMK